MLPITPKFIVGKVARRYIAGETLEDAVRTIRALNGQGAVCTVDVLGEFITTFDEAVTTAQGYEDLLDAIERENLDSNVSVKLTALGLLIDEARCTDLVRGIARKAQAQGNFVRVDMEDSPVTDMTLRLVRTLVDEGLPVGAVLQAYLRRTVDDAKSLANAGIPVRLCKGIYREPEAIAFHDREAIRDSYREALRVLLEGKGRVAIATHDDVLVDHAKALAKELEVPADRYEYQMLLGVREWLRDELIEAGEKVRIYVPFGTAWYGYSTRRLRENPQIAGHVFRALLGKDKPKKRPTAA
jgi:proline dehydrogenase